MISQLVLNKNDLKACGVTVIQSIHSSKRHAYPEYQAVYVIDPFYQEVGSHLFSLSVEWSFIIGFMYF